eukprot:512100_1
MDSFTNHGRLQINKDYGCLQHVFIIDNGYDHQKLNQYHININTVMKSKKKMIKNIEISPDKKIYLYVFICLVIYCFYITTKYFTERVAVYNGLFCVVCGG